MIHLNQLAVNVTGVITDLATMLAYNTVPIYEADDGGRRRTSSLYFYIKNY
jgi:hypothetical protein